MRLTDHTSQNDDVALDAQSRREVKERPRVDKSFNSTSGRASMGPDAAHHVA
ncbi:hypothetical protein FRC19_005906 [Serendipita sp. 401]|nr:hypothetical protein FRC19_005906 [Serendipita sp. 401]